MYFVRSRTKLSPDRQFRQKSTKWIDGIVLTRLPAPLTSLKPHFQNQKHTLVYTSPVPASQLKENMLKHLSTKVRASKFPLSCQSSVTNLLFVPCQKTCAPFLPSKSVWLHSVAFTFGLLRLLKKRHWWVKQGESTYPGGHLETSRPSGVLSDEFQSCTGTTRTNHNYHMAFTEGEHVLAFL